MAHEAQYPVSGLCNDQYILDCSADANLNFMQATLYVYEMKDGEMSVTKIEHPDPSLDS